MARYHLLWSRIPTPFTSIFNDLGRALDWVQILESRGSQQLGLVVVDICHVPEGHLWDAHQMAIEFGFPPWRVAFRENEYLFYRPIERKRVLAVFQVGGGKLTIPVHLGDSADEEALRAAIVDEVYPGVGGGIILGVSRHCMPSASVAPTTYPT